MTSNWTMRMPEITREQILLATLIAVVIAGGMLAFPLSFLSQTNMLLGMALIPYVIKVESSRRFNYVYFVVFLLFEVAAVSYGVRMFYFFALAFYILWLVEMLFGKVNEMILFLLVFMSPFFSQVSAILGFPIRLQLSQWAGAILRMINLQVQTEGNLISLNGAAFAVDEACMGLNMLAISLLMGTFMIAHRSRASQKVVKFHHLLFFFAICFVLNIIANLFRIVLLVVFKIEPGNAMHEVVGLLCLVVYVMTPLYLLAGWFLRWWGTPHKVTFKGFRISRVMQGVLIGATLSVLAAGVYLPQVKAAKSTAHNISASIPGFASSQASGNVMQLVNDDLLVYVKPIPEFFTGEHTPLLCWKGSGYEFKSINKTRVGDTEIYTGKLIKGDSQLFTAWWYSNNHIQTISQLDWRWRMLRGEEKFNLINITASNERTLLKNLQWILACKDFKIE